MHQTSLNILTMQSEAVNRKMTGYAMAEIKKNKGTNNDMQGATQTNTDRATRIM